MNAASQYLLDIGEDVHSERWDGYCGELANEILQGNDKMIYVSGPAVDSVGWNYHMVIYRDGKIHDAWLEDWHGISEPVSFYKWLVTMFGTSEKIEITIDSEDVFLGLPQNFRPKRKIRDN